MLDTFHIPQGLFNFKRVHVFRNRKASSFSSREFRSSMVLILEWRLSNPCVKEVHLKSIDHYDHRISIQNYQVLEGWQREPDHFLSFCTKHELVGREGW